MDQSYPVIDLWVERVSEGRYQSRIVGDGVDARHDFGLDFRQVAVMQTLRALEAGAAALSEAPPGFEANVAQVGQQLYGALCGGQVGEGLRTALEAAHAAGQPLRLRLRIAPPELHAIPWEFLHDGGRYLATARDVLLYRAPADLKDLPERAPIAPPLRVLVVVANPLDLPEDRQLDTWREEEMVLEAPDGLIRARRARADFVEEVSAAEIHRALVGADYHVIHFIGHGDFDAQAGRGVLLIEDDEGKSLPLPADQAANLLAVPGVRLVLLSSCLTARAPRTDAYASVAGALLRRGVPAAVAMQYVILEPSAIAFARTLYEALAADRPVDQAVAAGRQMLALPGRGPRPALEWATPVLHLRGAAGWRLRLAPGAGPPPEAPERVALGGLMRLTRGFVGRQKELRAIKKALLYDGARLVLVHGFGGIGKTVLATRAADKLHPHFDGVLGVRVRPDLGPDLLLKEFNDFLKAAGVTGFEATLANPELSPPRKAAVLGQVLRDFRLLAVLDNGEDWLDAGTRGHIADPVLAATLAALVGAVDRGSKFILTSRYAFDVLPPERAGAAVVKLPTLKELSRVETFKLIARYPSLAGADWAEKGRLYAKVGGNPFILNRFATVASELGVADALAQVRDVQRQAMDTFLLGWIWERLGPPGQQLLARMSVLGRPAPLACLEALMDGDHRATAEGVSSLIGRELMVKDKFADVLSDREEERYDTHTLVREFAREKLPEDERRDALLAAARFYEQRAGATKYDDVKVFNLVEARACYLAAGQVEQAGDITADITKPLHRWGFVEIMKGLNEEIAQRAKGLVRARALHHLGIIHQNQGNYTEAIVVFQQAVQIAGQLGDQQGIALVRYQLGKIHFEQGNYEEAIRLYQQVLQNADQLGDWRLVASILNMLGSINYIRGLHAEAIHLYEQALQIARQIGDQDLIAQFLGSLGQIHQAHGNYSESIRLYQQSLQIFRQLHYQKEVAQTLAALGTIWGLQGNYVEAIGLYQQAYQIQDELGNKRGAAQILDHLGILYRAQGNYLEAIRVNQRALEVFQQLGDQPSVAVALHGLGNSYLELGDHVTALRFYEQCLEIARRLDDKQGIARALGQIGRVYQIQGRYPEAIRSHQQALQIFQQLDDRRGLGVTLHQIAMVHQDQGNYSEAVRLYEESLAIKRQLGDPEGIASTLGQLGLVSLQQGDPRQAMGYVLQAATIFARLRSPHLQTALGALSEIKAAVGAGQFERWWREWAAELGAVPPELRPEDIPAAPAQPQGQAITVEEFVRQLVEAAAAALTAGDAGQRQALWDQLNGLQRQLAGQAGLQDLRAFVTAVQRLLEGASPGQAGAGVPAAFAGAWATLVERVKSS